MKYARVLLAHNPERTAELFKVYYSGQYQPRKETEQPSQPQEQTTSTVQSLAALLPLRYMQVGTGKQPEAPVPEPEINEDKPEDSPPDYEIPKPRTAFSAFVDHPKEFIDFLETLSQKPDLKTDAKIDIFTTLFEMYLDTAKGKKDASEKQEWETKAKKLIEGKDVGNSRQPCRSNDLTSIDSNLYIQRPSPVRSIRFPRRIHARPRTRRSPPRHFPLFHLRKRYPRCHQSAQTIRT